MIINNTGDNQQQQQQQQERKKQHKKVSVTKNKDRRSPQNEFGLFLVSISFILNPCTNHHKNRVISNYDIFMIHFFYPLFGCKDI